MIKALIIRKKRTSASYIHMVQHLIEKCLMFHMTQDECMEALSKHANIMHKSVQHLIEKCLIFHMTQDECMEALSKHANIKPGITSTVWKELEKENREFFEEYARNRGDRMSEAETTQKIQKIISESSTNRHSDDDEDDGD